MSSSNKDKASPEFKPAEFENAIQLSDFNREEPYDYSFLMADPEKQQLRDAHSKAQPTAKTSAKLEHREYAKLDPSYPSTGEDILYEHVLSQRRELSQKYREYEGDIVVDWCITMTKAITATFLIFMIVYTAVKWWSLGPHYARNYHDPDATLTHSSDAT